MLVALVICALLLAASITTAFLAVRKLLLFDQLWGSVTDELFRYHDDLQEMAQGDVLLDNPEVINFHHRNLEMLRFLNQSLTTIMVDRPARRKAPALPRPEVE